MVRARIDAASRWPATAYGDAIGLSMSDEFRLLMLRIAEERRLPFAIAVPNAATRRVVKNPSGREGQT